MTRVQRRRRIENVASKGRGARTKKTPSTRARAKRDVKPSASSAVVSARTDPAIGTGVRLADANEATAPQAESPRDYDHADYGYLDLMPIEELRSIAQKACEDSQAEAERLQAVRGIPSLPWVGATRRPPDPERASRMVFLEIIEATARSRQRRDSGELLEERRANMIRWGLPADVVDAISASVRPGIGAQFDAFNVRHWLRTGLVIGGICCTLPDVLDVAQITDDEICLAVDVWCRPNGRPPKGSAQLPLRWPHFAALLKRLGLGRLAPESLHDEWSDWQKSRRGD